MVDIKHKIIIKPRKIVIILVSIILLLVLASIAGQVSKYVAGHDRLYGFVPLFYLDNECNVPTFFSSIILLISAFLLGVITVFKKRDSDRYFMHWAVLSIIFLYLSFDEATSIHELFTRPVKNIVGGRAGPLSYEPWVIPFVALLLAFAALYWRFILNLPKRPKFLFMASGVIYIGGAIVIELFAGHYAYLYSSKNLAYSMIVTLEESLEMIGIVIFIYALLKYLSVIVEEVHFSVT